MRAKRTSPVMVASVRALRECTVEPEGLDDASSRSKASSARETASAVVLRDSSRALSSNSANDPHPPSSGRNACDSADAALSTIRFSMGLPLFRTSTIRRLGRPSL